MNYMLCRNRVRNFDQWKRVFDNHAGAHGAAGLKLVHVWHEVGNPRHVFSLFEIEDIERARAFLDSPDATASAIASGLIEGDFRFFSPSIGYGPSEYADSLASTQATERVVFSKDENDSSRAKAVNNPVSPEPVKSPESEKNSVPEKSPGPEKSSVPEKSPESEKSSVPEKSPEAEKAQPQKLPESEKSSPPEKNSTQSGSVKTEKPASSPSPPATMKGPERVQSAPPDEPFEGWKPVENWPPAEAEAEATHEPPHHHRRWERIKY